MPIGLPFYGAEGLRARVQPELAAEQGVVADLAVGVERQVVAGERDLGPEQRCAGALRAAP